MGILRFILALAVLIGHLGITRIVDGPTAVQLFFIISGFYMSMILNEKYTFEGAYWTYLKNRFLRIFPSYLVTILLTVLVAIVFHYSLTPNIVFKQWGHLNLGAKLYIVFANIFIIGQDLYMYLAIDANGNLEWVKYYNNSIIKVNNFMACPQAWSISLELLFYVIAPFLLKRYFSIGYILFIMGLSFMLRIIIYRTGYYFDPWTYRFFPTELLLFLAGNISYRLYYNKGILFFKAKNLQKLVWLMMVILLCYFTIIPLERYLKQIMLYVLFTLTCPMIFMHTKKMKWDRFIGDLSYPMYISHIFISSMVTSICAAFYPSFLNEYLLLLHLIIIIFTLLFSVLLTLWIDIPIANWKNRTLCSNR